jgi:hypothetical protein
MNGKNGGHDAGHEERSTRRLTHRTGDDESASNRRTREEKVALRTLELSHAAVLADIV